MAEARNEVNHDWHFSDVLLTTRFACPLHLTAMQSQLVCELIT